MDLEFAVASLWGATFAVVGVMILLLPKFAYWYLDRSVRPTMRIFNPSVRDHEWPEYREYLRWILGAGFVVVGAMLVGTAFVQR
jgi:hypothetical protein